MQSYWALVIGTLTGRATGCLISYLMHPMRPRLSLQKFNEIIAVSQWMLVRSSGMYLDNNLHKILVGQRTDSSVLGGYTLADEISAMPSTELLAPINRALFPAFVAAKENMAELRRLFLMAQGVQTLVGIPAGIGLAMVAPEVVSLLLGEKWLPAVPFIQILALVGSVQAITTSGGYVLITLGRARQLALISWAQVSLFVIAAFITLPNAGALALAMTRLAAVSIGFFTIFWLLIRALSHLSVMDMAATIARPIAAAIVMACALLTLESYVSLSGPWLLIAKLLTGAAIYTLTVLTLWAMFGRGGGAEALVIEKTKEFIAARKKSVAP
jgi:O-antigen/teichoic acid export membrane protein